MSHLVEWTSEFSLSPMGRGVPDYVAQQRTHLNIR